MLLPLRIPIASGIFSFLLRMGGPGLILIGLADNSVIPLPGSMDVLTIWLAASHRSTWWFYAILATAGALLGGYVTYALARKGGEEALQHKFDEKKMKKFCDRFKRQGFWAVAIPALLPPPFPMVPFLIVAGAMQYPSKKFLAALAAGRGVRFLIVAGLGAIYGKPIVAFFRQYYEPALFALIGLAVIGGILSLVEYYRHRHKPGKTDTSRSAKAA